jgi:hypothetical protein
MERYDKSLTLGDSSRVIPDKKTQSIPHRMPKIKHTIAKKS